MIDWSKIAKKIDEKSALQVDCKHIENISGGCINATYLLGTGDQRVFLKINQRKLHSMFEAEATGLNYMARSNAIRVPRPLCTGISDDSSFIALEPVNFAPAKPLSYAQFGRDLATMHRYQNSRYGAPTDNTIGSTPQPNQWSNDWYQFWREQRLGFQLDLAQTNHAPGKLIDDGHRLNEQFEKLFDLPPKPSCLHGDLWQGNWGFDQQGKPVIFDPAFYFGDREADIAMTRLFGGAPSDFYHAYEEAYPLSTGHSERETFYNLYHILNHFNLFGGGYGSQAHHMIQRLLSELG